MLSPQVILPVVAVPAKGGIIGIEHDRSEVGNVFVLEETGKSTPSDLVSTVLCAVGHSGLVEGKDVGPSGEKPKEGPQNGHGAYDDHQQK